VFTNIGGGGASYFVGLTPLGERNISQQEVIRQARATLTRRYPGTRISVSAAPIFPALQRLEEGEEEAGAGWIGRGNRLSLSIQGPDIDQLQVYTLQLMEKMKEIQGIADVSRTSSLRSRNFAS